jgi:hypothetical protein
MFYKVDSVLVDRLGLDAAFLYTLLKNISKIRKKDKTGFFDLWTSYIVKRTKWSKPKVIKIRRKIISAGLIEFRQGKNQNHKNKYKML